jgi:EmrB/QacA subfamily drug resistance transporter
VRNASSRLTLITLILAQGVLSIAGSAVMIALPAIQDDLHASVDELQWFVNGFLIAVIIVLLPAARWGDRFGRRRMLVIGAAVFAVGSLAAALATNGDVLLDARIAQGIGAGLVAPSAAALLIDAFPPAQHGRVLGVVGAAASAAYLAGPLLGGLLTQSLGWPWVFAINVPIAVAVVVLALVVVPESRDPVAGKRIDVAGIGLAAAGLVALLLGLGRGTALGVSGEWAFPLLGASAVLLALFVLVELRRHDPVLDVRIFRNREFAVATGLEALAGFVVLVFFFAMTLYLQRVLDLQPLQAALVLLPTSAVGIVLGTPVGRLIDRRGPRALIVAGLLILGAGLVWLAVAVTPDLAAAELLPAVVVVGIGIATMRSPITAAGDDAVSRGMTGSGTGVQQLASRLGGLVGVALLADVLGKVDPGSGMNSALRAAFTDRLTTTLLVLALVALAATVLAAAGLQARAARRARPAYPLDAMTPDLVPMMVPTSTVGSRLNRR